MSKNKEFESLELKELKEEYKEFSDKLDNIPREHVIPVYEWLLLTQYAMQGHKYAVKAVNDAYRLGYMVGKQASK